MKGERPFWFEPQRQKVPALELPLEPLSQDLREPPEHQSLNLARTQSGGLMFTNSKHQTAFHGLEQWESKHLFHYFNIQLVFHKSWGPWANSATRREQSQLFCWQRLTTTVPLTPRWNSHMSTAWTPARLLELKSQLCQVLAKPPTADI